MKPPVVLQVLPRLRTGGVERGTIEIAGAVARAGWRPLVASAGGPMESGLAYVGGKHISLPLASKNPWTIWRNAALLERIVREQQVDIIHARSRAPAWSAWLAAKRTGAHFVTTFHGVYGLHPPIKKCYNAVMTKGERVIAISEFIARHLQEEYHIEPGHIRTIPRGVDLAAFDPARILPRRMIDLANQWRIPDDLPLVLMPARITRWKGQHVLVDALARLPHRHFFCLLVGDDMGHSHYRREIESAILDRGLDGHIRLAGNTPHMAEAYMLADLVVAPSIEPEAFGRVPVEAQAMGRPVIATGHGGACETVLSGRTGWLVPPGDAQALAAAIAEALALDKEEKERIGAAGREHVRANFSAATMCQKTLEVYWELIGSRYE